MASSPVDPLLEAYAAGRAKATEVVAAVAAACYGDAGRRTRDRLRPLLDVIERAAPGVVELAGRAGGGRGRGTPGFEVRPAERPFPRQYEDALRRAAELVLRDGGSGTRNAAGPARGLFARLVAAVRGMFSASA